MRYLVYFSTEDSIEVVGEYWTLKEALENAQSDADSYNNGDENGDVVVKHHVDGEWAAGESTHRNNTTDKMIDDVINALTAKGAINNGGYGYLTLKGKTIRIKDHTHSPRNGKCDINVVIANNDATISRFNTAKEDMRFNESHSLNYIISNILESIQ